MEKPFLQTLKAAKLLGFQNGLFTKFVLKINFSPTFAV